MTKPRLSGRVRLSIVLSAMWLVGFGAHVWTQQRFSSVNAKQWRECNNQLVSGREQLQKTTQTEEEWNKKWLQSHTQLNQCPDEASRYYWQQREDTFKRIVGVLPLTFGSLLVAWFVVGLVLQVILWTIRGFASASPLQQNQLGCHN